MDYYFIKKNVEIKICKQIDNCVTRELINGFLYRSCDIAFTPIDEKIVSIGNCLKSEYSVVSESGIRIVANEEKSLIDDLFFVLSKAEIVPCGDNGIVRIPIGDYKNKSVIGLKMIHLCVFPESKLSVLKRAIRLAGVLGFTHVIVEFWGTFPYKCLKELSWKDHTLSHEELTDLISEIKALKMQPVPMVNHLGHASASRLFSGKHVVLDQNPSLGYYFINSGWTWNIFSEKTKSLLKNMRTELYEAFGEGDFFHIGFDESYYDPKNESEKETLYNYVREVCEEIEKEGRRPILWGDQFLNKEYLGLTASEPYVCSATTGEAAKRMLQSVPKNAVIADWHYDMKEYPWKTSEYFKKLGYDVIECPWYDGQDITSAIKTAEQINSFGVMLTTWHYLGKFMLGTPSIVFAGRLLSGETAEDIFVEKSLICSDYVRKVDKSEKYEDCGWTELQIEDDCG